VQLLGGNEREALRQVKAHLVAKDGERAGAGAVHLGNALVEDSLEQLVVGVHLLSMAGGCGQWKRWTLHPPRVIG
jgi:hypothetical protein